MKKKGKVEQEGSDISLRREKVFGEDVSRLFNGYDRRSINIIIVCPCQPMVLFYNKSAN